MISQRLIIKIVPKIFEFQSRDLREISVLNDLGCKVHVVAIGENSISNDNPEYILHNRTSRPLGAKFFSVKINRIVSLFTIAKYIRSLNGHIYSCHDLDALFIGWLANLFVRKSHKALLVYDSHEFELGRNTNGKRNSIHNTFIFILEKFLITKSAFSIMVTDSIADEVTKIYKLKTRPYVVRNIPPSIKIDENKFIEKRIFFCEQLNCSFNDILLMYHGGITNGRGIESLIKVISYYSNVYLIILGNGEDNYIRSILNLINNQNVSKKVLLHQSVAHEILWQYVGAVNIGMVVPENICKSYYFSLGNKFLENIQAETPIIASDFPELARIINKYQIGLLCNPEKIETLKEAIDTIINNSDLYNKFKINLKTAKRELCWENERVILENAYKKIIN